MPRATSVDLRERIVSWRHNDKWPIKKIVETSGVSRRTVYSILSIYEKHHQVVRPFTRPAGRPRLLDTLENHYLSSLISARPALYLDELQNCLFEACSVRVSTSTIHRTLERIAISHKQISREARERDDELRSIWKAVVGRETDPNVFVWCDESSIDDRVIQRRWGRSVVGQACVTREIFRRGERLSVLPAFSTAGVVTLGIFEGSVTKERFMFFLREHLVSFNSSS